MVNWYNNHNRVTKPSFSGQKFLKLDGTGGKTKRTRNLQDIEAYAKLYVTPDPKKSAELDAAYEVHKEKSKNEKSAPIAEVRFRRVWYREQLNKLAHENTESSRAILEHVEKFRSKKKEEEEMEEEVEDGVEEGDSDDHQKERMRIAKARAISE